MTAERDCLAKAEARATAALTANPGGRTLVFPVETGALGGGK